MGALMIYINAVYLSGESRPSLARGAPGPGGAGVYLSGESRPSLAKSMQEANGK